MNRNKIIGMVGLAAVMFGGYKLYNHDNEPKVEIVAVPADETAASLPPVSDKPYVNPNNECMILVKGENDEPEYIVGKCK